MDGNPTGQFRVKQELIETDEHDQAAPSAFQYRTVGNALPNENGIGSCVHPNEQTVNDATQGGQIQQMSQPSRINPISQNQLHNSNPTVTVDEHSNFPINVKNEPLDMDEPDQTAPTTFQNRANGNAVMTNGNGIHTRVHPNEQTSHAVNDATQGGQMQEMVQPSRINPISHNQLHNSNPTVPIQNYPEEQVWIKKEPDTNSDGHHQSVNAPNGENGNVANGNGMHPHVPPDEEMPIDFNVNQGGQMQEMAQPDLKALQKLQRSFMMPLINNSSQYRYDFHLFSRFFQNNICDEQSLKEHWRFQQQFYNSIHFILNDNKEERTEEYNSAIEAYYTLAHFNLNKSMELIKTDDGDEESLARFKISLNVMTTILKAQHEIGPAELIAKYKREAEELCLKYRELKYPSNPDFFDIQDFCIVFEYMSEVTFEWNITLMGFIRSAMEYCVDWKERRRFYGALMNANVIYQNKIKTEARVEAEYCKKKEERLHSILLYIHLEKDPVPAKIWTLLFKTVSSVLPVWNNTIDYSKKLSDEDATTLLYSKDCYLHDIFFMKIRLYPIFEIINETRDLEERARLERDYSLDKGYYYIITCYALHLAPHWILIDPEEVIDDNEEIIEIDDETDEERAIRINPIIERKQEIWESQRRLKLKNMKEELFEVFDVPDSTFEKNKDFIIDLMTCVNVCYPVLDEKKLSDRLMLGQLQNVFLLITAETWVQDISKDYRDVLFKCEEANRRLEEQARAQAMDIADDHANIMDQQFPLVRGDFGDENMDQQFAPVRGDIEEEAMDQQFPQNPPAIGNEDEDIADDDYEDVVDYQAF